MPFYAATVCEMVESRCTVDESLVAMLFPYLLAGLGPGVIPDYVNATYVIITQLSRRVAMSGDLLAGERLFCPLFAAVCPSEDEHAMCT